jgi:hypothetical protein
MKHLLKSLARELTRIALGLAIWILIIAAFLIWLLPKT